MTITASSINNQLHSTGVKVYKGLALPQYQYQFITLHLSYILSSRNTFKKQLENQPLQRSRNQQF